MPNYNSIAWIYDLLVKLIFGNRQDRANKEFIEKIPEGSRVLIVGGGTGRIINDLDKLNKKFEVDYVDISSKMIGLSKRKKSRILELNFYNKSILDFEKKGYDVIITNFFFDQFPQSVGAEIAMHLYPKLGKDGFLIFSDFITTSNFLDRFITALSFAFFRITANLATNRLPDYSDLFSSAKFKQGENTQISRNIIATLWYPIQRK